MKTGSKNGGLATLLERFPDEDACRAFLVKRRWPNGVTCPRCGNEKVAKVANRPWNWQCRKCAKNGYRFSPLVGTIFENTNYPLRAWFQVIFLMLSSKKGMSALQIHRMMETGSYETAWYMCHRIRAAMKDGGFFNLGSGGGQVEVDETFIGGKSKNRHAGKRSHWRRDKVPVIGAIARKGNVVCQVIERVDTKTLDTFVNQVVADDVSLVATDQWSGYKNLKDHGFPHETVNHAQGEYVRGQVHTAHLDSFWSLLKRGVIGTYHKVSKKHLPLYLQEFAWRHNHRKDPDMFDQVIAAC